MCSPIDIALKWINQVTLIGTLLRIYARIDSFTGKLFCEDMHVHAQVNLMSFRTARSVRPLEI